MTHAQLGLRWTLSAWIGDPVATRVVRVSPWPLIAVLIFEEFAFGAPHAMFGVTNLPFLFLLLVTLPILARIFICFILPIFIPLVIFLLRGTHTLSRRFLVTGRREIICTTQMEHNMPQTSEIL